MVFEVAVSQSDLLTDITDVLDPNSEKEPRDYARGKIQVVSLSGRVKFPGKITFTVKELCGSTELVVDAISQAIREEESEIPHVGRDARLKAFRDLTTIDALVDSLDRQALLRIDSISLLF